MKLIEVPPREGLVWVRRGFQVFLRQPFGFASLFAACALVFLVLLRVPYVGEPILLVVAPVGSLLFMIATRLGAAGQRPVPGAFVELATADRARRIRLLQLGIAYLVAAFIAIGLVAAVEGDTSGPLAEVSGDASSTTDTAATELTDPRVQAGFLLRLGLGALLSIPFWHAPGLVWWGAQGWARALFFSTLAIWRNLGAFAVYGLAWAGLGVAFAMALGIVVGLAGPLSATYVATPLVLAFTTVLYASLWFTFAGCFADDDPPAVVE
ncbi:MAG TPA: BPSS1780 family membrane protein [Caldimonas sp.]|nr:BPSS1780 family membrane protein [Caldimonas sp.]